MPNYRISPKGPKGLQIEAESKQRALVYFVTWFPELSLEEKDIHLVRGPHGGSRQGSGRPTKDYETVTVAFRIRKEWKAIIKKTVADKVAELKKTAPK